MDLAKYRVWILPTHIKLFMTPAHTVHRVSPCPMACMGSQCRVTPLDGLCRRICGTNAKAQQQELAPFNAVIPHKRRVYLTGNPAAQLPSFHACADALFQPSLWRVFWASTAGER
ncbi:hypothetical protein PG989_001221 [Apiospora arundinis]